MAKVEELADVRSESAIVASVICSPELVNFSENLSGRYFTDVLNGVIYDAVVDLYQKDIRQMDAFNIVSAISNSENLKSRIDIEVNIDLVADIVENAKYIARSTAEEYQTFVRSVMGLAYRRALYNDLSKAQSQILRNSDIIQLQRDVVASVERNTDKYIVGLEIPSIGEKIDSICEKIEKKKSGCNGYRFLSIPNLNKYLSMEKSEMTTILAPLKSGKSMMLMNLAMDCITQGARVILLDTEMTDDLFAQRLICYLSKVPLSRIKYEVLTKEENAKIEDAKQTIKKLPLWHSYIPVYTMDGIYGTVKNMKRKFGCDTLFFDYIKPSNSVDAYGTYAELGNLTNMLKNQIAGDLDMVVTSACQASRGGNIADSIRIGQYSTTVIKIKKKTMEEIIADGGEQYGNYRITVLFNRVGEQDEDGETWTDANFIGKYCTFEQSLQHNSESIFD